MSAAAALGALTIGLILGLLGSGGSIATVPILVYLVGRPEKLAIAESLIIVGGIAATSGIVAAAERRVSLPLVVLFGVPGMAGTYVGAWLGGMVSGIVQLIALAVVMLGAALMMMRPGGSATTCGDGAKRSSWGMAAAQGIGVGVLTGFVGVGGGFLIVPALVVLGGLPMRGAVGTSLMVIALNAAAGFYKHWLDLTAMGQSLDWTVVQGFLLVGTLGSLAGGRLTRHVPQTHLQRVFGVVLMLTAAFILWHSRNTF